MESKSTPAWTAIATWSPRLYSTAVADFTREVVAACGPASPARARALIHSVARLAGFAHSAGLPLDVVTVFHRSTIERFLAVKRHVYSQATLRTVATNIRTVAKQLLEPASADPLRLPRERAKAPYSPCEIDHYLSLAAAQPTVSRSMRASALICLGAGAGLTGADLRHVRGDDVQRRPGGLVVTVSGAHPRTVPVLTRFHAPLVAAADFAAGSFIVGGVDRQRKNVTSGLVASLAGGIDLPALSMRRLRSTWLAMVAEAIGLKAFMDAAGVDCSQRLGDIVSTLPPVCIERSIELLGGSK